MGAIVGALGRQSDAPNARKMTQRRPLNLISGKDELRWSFKTHSESFFLFCKLFRGKRWPLESILAPYGPNMCWACPGHLFSQYFPTPFPDVILNVFFMLCSTVLLQICTWTSTFFRPLVSPVVCLIFGIVLMTCSCSSLSADHTVRGGFPRGGKEGLKPLRVWQGSGPDIWSLEFQGLEIWDLAKTDRKLVSDLARRAPPCGGAAESASAHSAGP